MSGRPVMKLMLQLHGPPKCLERKCSQTTSRSILDRFSSHSIGRDEWCRKRRPGNPEKKFAQCCKCRTPKTSTAESRTSSRNQQDVQRHLSEVQNEVQSQQVARREEVGILHELSQFLIEGHIIRLYTLQADLGRPNVQSRHERDSWTAGCRGLETETIKDVKMQCSRKKEERRNGGGRDGGMKKSRRDMEKETEQEEAKREGKEEPQKERSQHRLKFLEVVQGGEQTSHDRMMNKGKDGKEGVGGTKKMKG